MNIELEMPSYEIAQIADLTVALEPVQENDYDSVWPAGGGKNKYSDAFNEYEKPTDYYLCPVTLDTGNWVIKARLKGTAITGCAVGIAKSGNKYTDFEGFVYVVSTAGTTREMTVTVDSSWTAPKLCMYLPSGETSFNSIFANYEIQLEKGSTATAYAPYSNICPITGHSEVKVYNGAVYGTADDTYTISLGDTVYGGTLDVLSGVLTVDRALYTFESTYRVLDNGSGLHYWIIADGLPSVNTTTSTVGNYISNMFVSGNMLSAGNFYVTGNGKTLVVVPWSEQQSITTVANANAWLADNPLEVCIPLATPTTVQLTAHDVETLTGINNVWSDSGDVTVTISGTTQTGDVVTVTALPQHKIQLFMP